jgi:uncharacterized protein (TIGR03435 family)
MKLSCLFLVAPLLHAQAQSASPKLAFDVASIKLSKSGVNGVRGGCHGVDSVYTPGEQAEAPPLGRCVITDARLSHLVGRAWDITMPMLKSGPDWIQRGDERYNVEAEAENPTKSTEAQLLEMLQALLIERFQMKFHFEPVMLPGFALTIAKGGTKLRESKSADADVSFDGGKPGGSGVFRARRFSMREFVRMLSGFGDHGPGVDRTGLTGLYDISLTWDNKAGPDISTALREQLGLQMRSEKVSTAYFVIDSAKRPSAN